MSLPTIGKVFLNGLQFTTDPKIDRDWPSRQSVLPGINGSVTVQDFDRYRKDMKLTLTSNGNFMNASLKHNIDILVGQRGFAYSYSDYTGLIGTVKILNFKATPTFIRDGLTVLYEYSLELKIMTLTQMDGVAPIGN